MKHKPDTPEGFDELRMMRNEHIFWTRESPVLKRDITLYPEMLTPEQQGRLSQIEKELVEMAYDGTEETKTVLKGAKREERQ